MIPAQELVERGLAAADAGGADGCIVLVEETSHVDVRFALNTTTTNGVQRGRSVSVIALAGTSVGSARRSGVVGADGVADMAAAALADARGAPPAEDAFPLVEVADARPARDFGLDPEETDSGALEGVLGALSGAFGRARARDAVLAGFAEQDLVTLYLGSSTGLRLSHAQPTGAVSLVGRTADGSGSAWVGEPTIAPSLEQMEQEVWRRLDWATTSVPLEAGRYEVIMPPSAVSDMMAMLAFDALGGQDAEDGRSVFSKEGGGTRVGEQITTLPFTLYSDPFEHGIACTPFVAAEASGPDTSVFDNGLPVRPHRLAARRRPGPAALPPRRRGPVGRRDGALHRQPGAALRRGRTGDRSTTWWRAPSAGSCSPASGTSGWSIRPRCSRPGSPVTASTWSRTVRWWGRRTTSASTRARSTC